jgi:hypothetical protein
MEHWYCLDKQGLATLCANKEDAELTVKECDLSWPKNAPHRVGRVFDANEFRRVGVVEPLMGTMRTVIWDEGMIPSAGTTLWAKDE